jgi:hypothetical protein
MDAPSYKNVLFFPTLGHMSQGITLVTAQAVIERFQRLTNRDDAMLAVPWGGGQSEQDELDQFYQCAIALSSLPELYPTFDWWIRMERRYLARKLQFYWAHRRHICKAAGIDIEGRGNKIRFMVPGTTGGVDQRDKPWEQLATLALRPLALVERVQALVARRYSHVAHATPEMVAALHVYMEAFQAELLLRIQADQASLQ